MTELGCPEGRKIPVWGSVIPGWRGVRGGGQKKLPQAIRLEPCSISLGSPVPALAAPPSEPVPAPEA